jgi:hypothetical protein
MIYFYTKLSRDLFEINDFIQYQSRLFAQFAIITSVDSIKIVITINRSCLLTVQGSTIKIYHKFGLVDAVTYDFIYP